jgi:succinyl-CoA synthetase alpha subunit
VSLIVGRHAPEGKKMGHAGAIIRHGSGLAADKIGVLREAGVHVVNGPREIPAVLKELIGD